MPCENNKEAINAKNDRIVGKNEEKLETEGDSIKCSICGGRMRRAGEIMPYTSHGRRRRIPVYQCGRCGHRTT